MSEKMAMYHLGRVLSLLRDLSPGERCTALEEAFEFYNTREDREFTLIPIGIGYTVLDHKFPGFDADFDEALMPPHPWESDFD